MKQRQPDGNGQTDSAFAVGRGGSTRRLVQSGGSVGPALPPEFTSVVVAICLWLGGTVTNRGEGTPAPTDVVNFAAELSAAGHHEAAAVEYRRLAMEDEQPTDQAAYYWAAAYQYFMTNDTTRAHAMLERAETAADTATIPALLLRADLARNAGDDAAAAFYYESMLQGKNLSAAMKEYCQRQLAGLAMVAGNVDDARRQLEPVAEGDVRSAAEAAIDGYVAGHDKRPGVGGTLGLIPGLGHMYAGEFANGFRCLILNGIFIYGMSDTADSGNWGAFAVITFFELTWYSGSIYGGRDAVERYNHDRLVETVGEIEGPAEPKPDLLRLPLIQFSF